MRRRIVAARAVGLLGLLLVAGACGSGSGGGPVGGSCATLAGCGGNVVGNWTVMSSCYALHGTTGPGTSCAGQTIDAQGTYSGTISMVADASYALSLSVSVTEAIWYPATCLSAQGVTTCDQLTQLITSQATGSGITSVQCTPSPRSGCDCTASGGIPVSTQGTYAASGSTLTFTPTASSTGSASPSTFSYCASVNQLDLIPPPQNSDGFTASGDIRLVRQ
jgi:hypothetical protein